jgi:hypothetical protein
MDVKHIPNRIEIAFWSTAILIMTESSLLRSAVESCCRLAEDGRYKKALVRALLWGGAGLGLGLVLGLITA